MEEGEGQKTCRKLCDQLSSFLSELRPLSLTCLSLHTYIITDSLGVHFHSALSISIPDLIRLSSTGYYALIFHKTVLLSLQCHILLFFSNILSRGWQTFSAKTQGANFFFNFLFIYFLNSASAFIRFGAKKDLGLSNPTSPFYR